MKKTIKRMFLLFVAFACIFVVSCKKDDDGGGGGGGDVDAKTYNITYVLNGGTLSGEYATTYKTGTEVTLPEPTNTDASKTFGGWYENEALTGTVVETISSSATGDKTFYAQWILKYDPKHKLNQVGFQGKGMTIGIKVLPVSQYDPFDSGYTGTHKTIMQKHQRLVEDAYNVVIKWSAWNDSAPWGPERVKFIKQSYLDGSFADEGTYIVTLDSNWIPTLTKADALAALGTKDNGEGIFKDFGYEQNTTINEACSVQGKVYGYEIGDVRPDQFIYYNADLAAECGLEDPAEMWFKGTWTLSNYESWVQKAQTALAGKEGTFYAVDFGAAEYTIAMTGSLGAQMVKQDPAAVLFTKTSVTRVFDEAQKLYSQNMWNKAHGTNDVSTEFLQGNTILTSGSLWFLKDQTRFDPNKITFEIGCVPYPCSDGNGGVPVTTTNVEEAILSRTNEPLTTEGGAYISGVNMDASTYQCPYTSGGCFSIMNIQNGKNNITSSIAFGIIYDLQSGLGDDPKEIADGTVMTPDEGYEVYLEARFDHKIYVDTIMSVQNNTYFEMMELLSMTVGGGSHFGPDAFWPLAQKIVSNTSLNAQTTLASVLDKYKQALSDLGYIVA